MFDIFFEIRINSFFNFTVFILILPYLSIVVHDKIPVKSLIVTRGRVPEMDILFVINPINMFFFYDKKTSEARKASKI